MAKRNKKVDPFAEREAMKYEHPIPSREFILETMRKVKRPILREEISKLLKLKNPEELEGLRRRLRAMERDGQLIFLGKKGYGLLDKVDLYEGRIIGHKDGFGFVVLDHGEDDLFLSARYMRAVFDGDRVSVRIIGIDRRGRREAALVEVLERNTHQIVGRFFIENGVGFVVPDNKRLTQDILIPLENRGDAENGQIVVVDIVEQPSLRSQAIGKVTEVLGEHMAPGMEIDVAIRAHELPHVWPLPVLNEIKKFSTEVEEVAKQNRVDLRHLPLVTIDGEDAKDFDDAVYCEKNKKNGGWILYVAIADVSYYVHQNTALDKEAFQRGNSVYFPGEVIPMLPEILSNGLCSLKPQVDRLCMVCELKITPAGRMSHFKFYEAVMHSAARLTYTEVAAMLQNNKYKTPHMKLLPELQELYRLYQTLRTSREKRGAIDFETTETKVVFGKDRKIEQIIPVERNEAHKIIEECMLAANVAAAKFILKSKISGLYRIHAGPTVEKLADLRKFLAELRLGLRGGKEPTATDYARLLKEIVGRPDAHLIQTVLLRSLSQAVYQPDNIGHFGLAYPEYTHFTSPIRRYPDLLTHRAIRYLLQKGKADDFAYDLKAMLMVGEHCSMTERRADEATRDALDWLKCEYMLDRVGEEFDGIITAVTGFGLFAELQNIYVEGLVHVTSLKSDFYRFDPIRHRLTGERTGIIYRIGDKIRVRVVCVDLDSKKIDFELVEAYPSHSKKTKTKTEAKKSKKNKPRKIVKQSRKKRKR